LSTGKEHNFNEAALFGSVCEDGGSMIREPTPLGRVMIRCAESGEGVPASGEGVPRGTRIDAASLKSSNLSEQTFRCPHCGHEHTWSAKDAWVEYVD
jgi:hypothetical protein